MVFTEHLKSIPNTCDPDKIRLTRAHEVFNVEIQAVTQLRDRLSIEFDQTLQLMHERLAADNKFIITGVGKSGHIGSKIASTFTSTGAPALFLDPMNALHGDMGVVLSGDLIFLISYSGETEEILRLLPHFRRLHTHLVAITGNPNSTLAHEADVCLNIQVEQEACPLNLAPTSSTTATLVLGDALAMVLLSERGFKKEDFLKYHPGGTIGKNLLIKVDQIMRPLERMAICHEDETVFCALAKISKKRCGAIAIINKDGTLAGIYTHGDFARGYQKDKNIGQQILREVMTPEPITVRVDKLAVEVLNIFEKYPIQDLIVLDQTNRPVGLIDVQDLPKSGIL